MQTKKFIVSHAGKQHSYHLAKALLDGNLLEAFYTSSYVGHPALQKLILASGNTFFTRRFKEGLGNPYVHSHWSFEAKEFLMRMLQGKSLAVQNQVYQRDVDFDRMMASKMKDLKGTHFWGFQGSCHDSLLSAKDSGKVAICELATAHVVLARKILNEEALLKPDWADSIDNLYFPKAYEKRLEMEPQVADWVVAASEFTKFTVTESGIPESKIKVLPLGFEADKIPFSLSSNGFSKRPLRLLFAGTITQRKGIAYLLDAMKLLGGGSEIELHLVGGIQGSGAAFQQQKGKSIYHPPVSQYEMFQLYKNYDALVLPTVFEGFGLVIVEAMAAGLPVITTSHSMGPDAVEQGKNGWIVPIRDVEAIGHAISELRAKSDEEFESMRIFARESALKFTWERYSKLLKHIAEII